MTTMRKPIQIDRYKLREEIRKLSHANVYLMLDDAIEFLPPAKLGKLAKKYVDLKRLSPDTEQKQKSDSLGEVKRFEQASLAGEFYESFGVNSKSYMELSAGTTAWMAKYLRLQGRCAAGAKTKDPSEVREALDRLFGLLDHIDEGHDDVIFFADEGGSWQVCVDWDKVLPVWFKVLSATATPEEYARRITTMLARHCHHNRAKMLAVAQRTATAPQRKALADVNHA
jgi:hypothetical protein